jgi:hypothetical protein
MNPRQLLCLVGVALLGSAGCGRGSGAVTGVVTFQNKTVASGTVIIVGSDLLPYYGNIEADGTYTVPRVPIGFAKIAVFSPGPDSASQFRSDLPAAKPGVEKRALSSVFRGDPKTWFPLPEKYREFDTSGLTLTVGSGVNPRDIELD